MALVSTSIPNLINGISQQPAEIRLASQAERQINGLSSIARGLEKRPGTEHQSRISTTSITDSFIHSIRRDREEEYTMVLTRLNASTKTLKIYDKEGTSVPVKTEAVANATLTGAGNHDIDNGDLAYLEVTDSGGVSDNIVATTVADTTFLINKTKDVEKADVNGEVSGEGTSDLGSAQHISRSGSVNLDATYDYEGLVYVKTGDYSSKYVVTLTVTGGTLSGNTYKIGYQTPASNVAINQGHVGTTNIAQVLMYGGVKCTGAHWDTFADATPAEGFGGRKIAQDVNEDGDAAAGGTPTSDKGYFDGFAAVTTSPVSANSISDVTSIPFVFALAQSSSVIVIKSSEPFTIDTADSHGGKDLVGITTSTTSFTNLPGTGAPDKYIVCIKGSSDATQDDFYVQHNEADETWKECLAPSTTATPVYTGFNVTTMPHRLIRVYDTQSTPNKYFIFEPVSELAANHGAPVRYGWSSRKAGDDTSNPFPTFLGGKINDICFHKNRFGILSDENIIFSAAGNFYNFFPISVMTALESNPIDISVSNNQVSLLRHAAAFDQSLLLFSDFQQFSLNNSGESFSPATVSVDVVTQFESTSKAPPVSSGRFVYFPFQRGEYSGVREYFVATGSSDANDATDITAHVPQYIKGNITRLIVSSTDQMVAVLSDDDLTRVYIYKNFWQDQEKLQNSWSHWTFDGDILNCAFLGSTLKLLVKRTDGLYLEDINLSLDSAEAVMEDDTAVLLDRRVKLGSVVLTGITLNGSSTTVTVSSTSDLRAGMTVDKSGSGIYVGTTISSITNSTTLVLSAYQDSYTYNDVTLTFTDVVATSLPYYADIPANMVYVTDNARKLSSSTASLTQTMVNEYLAEDKGDAENEGNVVYAGIPYTFEYEFSRFIHKENDLPVQTAKLQIRNINLLYNKTGFFNIKVNVSPGTIKISDGNNGTTEITPRKNYSKNFSGMITNTSSLGEYKLLSGTFKSSVMTNSSNCNIILENDEYLPCAFQSAEWEGFLHVRSQRV